ncbi:MAG: AMP-binding protein [Desulfomonile sp.]
MKYDDRPWLNHYPPGQDHKITLPEITLVEHIERIASEFPREPAIYFLGVTISYQELMAHSNRFAQALIQNGILPGDVVGINLPNSPQYVIAQVGALKAGCAASGVSPLLTPRELAYQLGDSRARVLVTLDAIFEHRFLSISDQLPDLKLIVATGILDFLSWIKQKAARILKKVPHGRLRPVEGKTLLKFMDILSTYPDRASGVKVRPEDHCLIMYTGGTTGTPKGTIITHRNMMTELAIVTGWLNMELGKEVILSAFPLFHIAGLALALGTIFIGSVQILIPNPRDTKHIVKEMAKYKPTILVNVPSLYMMLLEEPGFRKLDFSRLSFCLSAASPFPVESIGQLEDAVGEGKMLECYGLTEVSSLATMNPRRGTRKVGTVGVPLPNTMIRLVDLGTGTIDVPFGEEGEIVVSGPQVMMGYLNKPDETALSLKERHGETWLHTGDIGRMDSDGFLTIVDRTKDMLNVGGYKVFSREIEDKLYENPAIEFCAIIGVPNPKRPGSDLVKLVVQPSPYFKNVNQELLKAEILAFARENFAPYKVPKIIEFVETIPLTAVGKVDKKALK